MWKKSCAIALALMVSGCVTAQTTSFRASLGQEMVIRDGRPSIYSNKAKSVVVIAPAERQSVPGARPTFVVGIMNRVAQPVNFSMTAVQATQTSGPQNGKALHVFTYEELVQEEKNRQVAAAILVGIAAGANAAAAGSYRNPYVRTWNQHIAARENSAMIAGASAQGQINMAALETMILKDNTLLPGESYGGVMQVQSPVRNDLAEPASLTLQINIEGEAHIFDVRLDPIKQ
ncbi:MAG: hypothetical protein JNM13_15530 [Hyphomicrobiaceae bacterium]|nr:hypothetical protein [Hyphomicrobiaceae bacterium]